jgi:hypothetical protein
MAGKSVHRNASKASYELKNACHDTYDDVNRGSMYRNGHANMHANEKRNADVNVAVGGFAKSFAELLESSKINMFDDDEDNVPDGSVTLSEGSMGLRKPWRNRPTDSCNGVLRCDRVRRGSKSNDDDDDKDDDDDDDDDSFNHSYTCGNSKAKSKARPMSPTNHKDTQTDASRAALEDSTGKHVGTTGNDICDDVSIENGINFLDQSRAYSSASRVHLKFLSSQRRRRRTRAMVSLQGRWNTPPETPKNEVIKSPKEIKKEDKISFPEQPQKIVSIPEHSDLCPKGLPRELSWESLRKVPTEMSELRRKVKAGHGVRVNDSHDGGCNYHDGSNQYDQDDEDSFDDNDDNGDDDDGDDGDDGGDGDGGGDDDDGDGDGGDGDGDGDDDDGNDDGDDDKFDVLDGIALAARLESLRYVPYDILKRSVLNTHMKLVDAGIIPEAGDIASIDDGG